MNCRLQKQYPKGVEPLRSLKPVNRRRPIASRQINQVSNATASSKELYSINQQAFELKFSITV